MGTAKNVSLLQYYAFRWVMVHLYPEPYRIPSFLLPAFDVGVECGKKTGKRNLYREPLEALRAVKLCEARQQCEIDVEALRVSFRKEQERIPFTIASLRLPTN
jgi:hypothetical protein